MNDVEALIELAKMASSRHDERRKYEWKVSFAFWAIIIGAIIKKNELHLQCINIWIGAVLCTLYAFLWLRGVWVANDNDKRMSEYFRKLTIEKLSNPSITISSVPGKTVVMSFKYFFGFLADWAMLFHLTVTVILIVLFYYVS
jgi:hypothetical protein